MGGRRATDPSAARGWAVVALAALAGLAVTVVVAAVRSRGALVALALDVVLSVAIAAAAAWWAFTTRRVWKRRLNVAVAALVVAGLMVALVVFGFAQAAVMLVAAVGLAVYGVAARRALATAGPERPQQAAGPPPQRPWLLVNPRSGGGKAERLGLAAAAAARGVRVHVLVPGDDPAALAGLAVADGADALGVAGGDGTLGQVAAVAVEAGVPFVCIPVGTRNHFAADLGLDRDRPLAALAAFGGPEHRVDVGMVGERMFLNNVSLGAYADMVAEPGYRGAKLATAHEVLPGALRGERELLRLAFSDPAGRAYHDALVLLVANNRYELRGSELGMRESLADGVLQVSALLATTGAAIFGLAARIAAGRLTSGPGWSQWTATTLRVDAPSGTVAAGVDGEAAALATPLEFRVVPAALRVLVPPDLPARVWEIRPQRWATVRRLWRVATGPAAR